MFKMVSCNEDLYERLVKLCRVDGDMMSQEDLYFCGIRVASMQLNFSSGRRRGPDFYWCRKFLKWFIK